MRVFYNFIESITPNGFDDMTFYHGTKLQKSGKAILKQGIRVKPNMQSKGMLKPMDNRIYLTPHLSYALIYAVGGDILENGNYDVASGIKTDGRFGYVFEVSGKDLSGDVIPDEDIIGNAIYFALLINNNNADYYHNLYTENPNMDVAKIFKELVDDVPFRNNLLTLAMQKLTKNQLSHIQDGDYAYWAASGKKLLPLMSDSMKHRLIKLGSHVSHAGTVMPNRAWKIDKKQIPLYKKDGSNFFDLATPIPLSEAMDSHEECFQCCLYEDMNRRKFIKTAAGAGATALGSAILSYPMHAMAKLPTGHDPAVVYSPDVVKSVLLKVLEFKNIDYNPSIPLPKVVNRAKMDTSIYAETLSFEIPEDAGVNHYHWIRNWIILLPGTKLHSLAHELVHYIQMRYEGHSKEDFSSDNLEMEAIKIQRKFKK